MAAGTKSTQVTRERVRARLRYLQGRAARRRVARLCLLLAGTAVGLSCPYWPEDAAWVCVLVARVAEVLRGG